MLNPLAIRRQQFTRAFRGYDSDEVDTFLKGVADEWEGLAEERRLADERVREMEVKLKHYERVELALQEALEAARESAQRAQTGAEQKARLIVEEAELRAQRVLQDAEQERYGIRQDLARLTTRQNEVAARLRAFLMSELEILAQFQGDDPIGFIRLVGAGEPNPSPRAEPARPAELPARFEEGIADDDGRASAASESSPAAEPEDADTWSLRSLVTGEGGEASMPVSSEAERERIRRILDDLD